MMPSATPIALVSDSLATLEITRRKLTTKGRDGEFQQMLPLARLAQLASKTFCPLVTPLPNHLPSAVGVTITSDILTTSVEAGPFLITKPSNTTLTTSSNWGIVMIVRLTPSLPVVLPPNVFTAIISGTLLMFKSVLAFNKAVAVSDFGSSFPLISIPTTTLPSNPVPTTEPVSQIPAPPHLLATSMVKMMVALGLCLALVLGGKTVSVPLAVPQIRASRMRGTVGKLILGAVWM